MNYVFYFLAQYGLNVSLQISEGFEGMAFVFRRSPDTVFSLKTFVVRLFFNFLHMFFISSLYMI